MSIVPFVDLAAQYRQIRAEVLDAMGEVLDNTSYILGPQVAAFEDQFAAYCQSRYCVGVESGTAALVLALRTAGIGAGDEVILPANTYIACAFAVSAVGATPVLVDVDDRYQMDFDLTAAAITHKTRAIMPVHLYGQAVDAARFGALARANGLVVIEDGSQAHGASFEGKRIGSTGDFGCFSFYPGKNLGAYGDGGAIVTDDPELAERIRLLRDFGQLEKYHHVIKGDNCRLDTLQAAVLLVKLKYLDSWNSRRREAAQRYDTLLEQAGLPACRVDAARSVYHLYVVEVPERDRVRGHLEHLGIQVGIHYPIPIHRQPAYRELQLESGSFPVTERAAGRLLSLPMFAEITEAQIDRVVAGLESAFSSLGLRTLA